MKGIAVTGIRSEYDILYPIIDNLRLLNHDISIVITGAHLSEHQGDTYKLILKDGFKIVDKIDTLFSTSRLIQRSKSVGLLVHGLSQVVERENPDFLLVIGDREESIATAIVGNYTNTLVVHVGGGDPVYGNSDDPIRFSVSKLAHLHCCFTSEYSKNLINIGEEDFRVVTTGNPSYTNIDNVDNISLNNLKLELNIPIYKNKYLVLIKHPLSSEVKESKAQMEIVMQSLKLFCTDKKFCIVCITPNSDPGSQVMIDVVKKYSNEDWLYIVPTLSRRLFVNLMRHAQALVGNSSMGVLEAPHYKLPVVNIGNRQKGRLNAGNVKFVKYNNSDIYKAIENACFNKDYREKISKLYNPYGDGLSAKKVCKAIESIDLCDSKWYVKNKLCP